MMHTRIHYVRKFRQLSYLLKRLNAWTQSGRFAEFSEKRQKRLLQRLRSLFKQLAGKISPKKLKLGLATMALLASMHSQAQNFVAPVTNPFGLTSAQGFGLPSLVDLDDDDDLDILAGVGGGNFYYYENTGTASNPSFAAPLVNPFGLTQGFVFSEPSFADLDDDGDLDLLAGIYGGDLNYYENTGSAAAPAFAAPVMNPFGLDISQTSNSAFPELLDLDDDGDYDAFVTDQSGQFQYFENTGTASMPSFALPLTNPFGLFNNTANFTYPAIGDLDIDGDFDILVGDYYGGFGFYENTGTAMAPAFIGSTPNPFNLGPLFNRNHPALGDLDDDGDLDVLSGAMGGDLVYFENNDTTSSNNPPGIATIPNDSLCVEDSMAVYNFSASDIDGDSLSFVANSSNQSLLPNTNLFIDGINPNYILTAIPAPGQTGTTTISIQVSDGQATDSTSFELFVEICNTAPIIDAISNQTVCNDTTLGPIPFDAQDPNGDMLTLTASSSDQSLVMDANIEITNTGTLPPYSLELIPEMGASGTCTITVTVDDGTLSEQTSFDVEIEDCSTGLRDSDLAKQVKIYPNPTQGEIAIRMESGVFMKQVKLYDLQGKCLQQFSTGPRAQALNLNLSSMASGMYLLEIQSTEGQLIRKVRKD